VTRVEATHCSIAAYDSGFRLTGYKASVKANQCSFDESLYAGFHCMLNGNLEVTNCFIRSSVIMTLFCNDSGTIWFRDNQIVSQPLINKDVVSKTPDFDTQVQINLVEVNEWLLKNTPAKVVSRNTHLYAEAKRQGVSPDGLETPIKKCFNCGSNQLLPFEPFFKNYPWCSKCKASCYCSKKCQQEHWKDHKFQCK